MSFRADAREYAGHGVRCIPGWCCSSNMTSHFISWSPKHDEFWIRVVTPLNHRIISRPSKSECPNLHPRPHLITIISNSPHLFETSVYSMMEFLVTWWDSAMKIERRRSVRSEIMHIGALLMTSIMSWIWDDWGTSHWLREAAVLFGISVDPGVSTKTYGKPCCSRQIYKSTTFTSYIFNASQ